MLETLRKHKYILIGVLVVLIACVAVWVLASSDVQNKTDKPKVVDAHPDRIRMLLTGDFIAHDSVNTAARNSDGTYDYLPLMHDFVPIFKQADIRFCNDPILNGGKQFGITGYPNFNSPTEFVTDMGKLGCNLVNTASNHSFDKTQDVLSASVSAWDNVPNMLAVAGQNRSQAEHDTVHYFTVKGVKFAFLAYTSYLNNTASAQNDYGVSFFTKEFASSQIEQAKAKGAQVIITSIRWGTEYSTKVDDNQKEMAQFLADEGVNLVIGHGSHMLQPVEQMTGADGNKTTILYSVGNFLNSQIPAETLFNGMPIIDFDTKTKQITSIQFLPIYMHYKWSADQAKTEDLQARKDLYLYLLEDATQDMIDAQRLRTSVEEQKKRMSDTLGAYGVQVPLITSDQLTR